ncbi:MAG TPA: DUF692 domain-containing protein [Methylocella sp.]|nr:DUF692 domain-containing protein [Methylocella sp.]
MITSRLPASAGVGFKPHHFSAISAAPQPVGFFEIHAENYMGKGGPAHAQLRFLRENYALSIHGVGLNIGSPAALDREHLARLKRLLDLYEPESFSEHLAWSGHDGFFFNDLLPIPYDEASLRIVIAHVDEAQTVLGQRLLLENPATYIRFAQSQIPETEFLREIAKATGCGLLLDLNNVFISSRNHNFDAAAYLAGFPLDAVGEIHLAGHFESKDDQGDLLLIDAHQSGVCADVLTLFDEVIAQAGPLPALIEWDNEIPAWDVLLSEARAAQERLDRAVRCAHNASAAA